MGEKIRQTEERKTQKNDRHLTIVMMVGATGFEPATPWSQTMCATELRYAPMVSIVVDCGGQCKHV